MAGVAQPETSTSRHRVASGLPLQPPPLAGAKIPPRPNALEALKASVSSAALGTGPTPALPDQPAPGLLPPAPSAAMAKLATPISAAFAAARASQAPRDPGGSAAFKAPPAPGPAKPESATPRPPPPSKVAPVLPPSGREIAGSGTPSAVSARVVLGAGEPEPPISGGPIGGLGASVMEQKRITPRSPRAALQPEHVPLPAQTRRPSRRARNPLVIIGNAVFTLLILVLLAGGGVMLFGNSRLEAPGPLMEDKVVVIPAKSGMMDIADLLNKEGVIDEHRLVFAGGVFALGARNGLKAGEYLFQKHASVRDVVETIVQGKTVQHQITIPEGLTSEQIVARILENEVLAGNVKDVPREGSLLPDSYHFNRGFAREQLIARMRQAQDRLVREVWERRNPDLPLKTPEQLIILASIIEKETGKPEERTRVAAVFVNRLKQKMKLQSDPTIVYGLVFGKGSLGRPISKADIQSQTPYNTYVIEGLPPGPISNPGRASIEAAANPARTKEVFFVADGSGGHAFAETYDQHQKNVARLRVIEHGGEAPAEAQPAATPARATPAAKGKRGPAARSAGAAQ
jgi:UPF0755 protein